MRLPLIKPTDLTEQQEPLFEDMKQGIAANFQGFANIGSDGALLAPGIRGCMSQSLASPCGSL